MAFHPVPARERVLDGTGQGVAEMEGAGHLREGRREGGREGGRQGGREGRGTTKKQPECHFANGDRIEGMEGGREGGRGPQDVHWEEG